MNSPNEKKAPAGGHGAEKDKPNPKLSDDNPFVKPRSNWFVTFHLPGGSEIQIRPQAILAVTDSGKNATIWIGAKEDDGWSVRETVDEVLEILCDVE